MGIISGIAAVFGSKERQIVQLMLEKIRHRGPDAEDIYAEGSAQLGEVGFRDAQLEPVLQGGYGVALDGEPLYKDRNLSKSELLEMYLKHGPAFVKELEGKFAFIISNGADLFAARDLFGITPLYYLNSDTRACFASEMKALVKISDHIEIFPPGHYFTVEEGLQRYRKIPPISPSGHLKLEEAEIKLRNLLLGAVKRVFDNRENVGIFLSGGVDSSIIAAAARQAFPGEIFSYVAGLEGSPDIENARMVAGHLGTEHREYIYTPREMLEILPEVIYYLESFDVELVNSSIANYFVSRLANSHETKVILSGEGADELFGGYHFLKKYKDDNSKLAIQQRQLLEGLHSGGFQRVDRMAKAHSLEVEMPFMDAEVVQFALQLPSDWKISEDEMGKWLLRKAFAEEIPEQIVWRRKAQFGVGSGTENIMQELIAERMTDQDFQETSRKTGSLDFKSREECYYYKIFREFFPGKSALKTVNRWLVN